MPEEPFHRLPDRVEVRVSEIGDAIARLERAFDELTRRGGPSAVAHEVDGVIGSMTRWLWPLLRDLDEEGDQ
jgi:hypothetical protein